MAKLSRKARKEQAAEQDEAPEVVEEAPAKPKTADDVDISPGGGRLGELLVEKNLVNRGQLVEALLQQDTAGKRLGSLLVELGTLDEASLTEVLAEQAGVEMVDLREVEPEPEAVERLSEVMARSLAAVPLRHADDGTLEIVVADPGWQTQQKLEEATGATVRLLAAPATSVHRLLDNTYRALADVGAFVERFEAATSIRRVADEELKEDDEVSSEDAPVVRVVNLLITQALRDRASDIHVESQDTRVRIRYRIDGALHDVVSLPANMGPALVSRLKIMAGMNIVERRKPQDGNISMSVEGRELDIRVATTPTIWGEKVVLRLLDKSKPMFQLSDLGMSKEMEEQYEQLVRSPFGMVVCTGPTGSGKTTSLYATIMEINDSERNITTIEDPVEYILPAINQIQINDQAGVSFVTGLRSILRQDPDIILVGEIRDTDTARIAIRSALTGHLVLSSLHSTDASSALARFVDMGVEPFLVTSSVLAIVAQRLVRRICTYCTVPYKPTDDELAFYRNSGGEPKTRFFHGEGCNFCAQTGYQERIGVYELLVLTEDIKELVVNGGSRDQIRNLAVNKHGMRTLRQEGLRLVAEDTTTISEVVKSIWVM